MDQQDKKNCYDETLKSIAALISGEHDEIALMATVACELHQRFDYFHWTGFYRVVAPELLKVGPYQGGHGCLSIPFSRGVCGAAARLQQTQLVDDVNAFDGHIFCASSTQSEIVLPVFNAKQQLIAVLDVDSDFPAAFDVVDQQNLEKLCAMLAEQLR